MRPVIGGIVVASLFGVITAGTVVADQPRYGISYYAVIPIVLAAFWLGRRAALAAAGIATVVFLCMELLFRPELWSGMWLWVAAANRSAVYFIVAAIVTGLVERERRLRTRVRRQKQQLDELQSIRDALTPADLPDRPGLEVAAAFLPADGPVAGDFFLVAPGPADSTTFVVGDVVGHGFEAARRASFVRAVIATFAPFSSDPARLLQLANTALTERLDVGSQFVTAVCVNVSPQWKRMSWASAGHDPPWMLDSGEALDDGCRSVPLGLKSAELHLEAHSRTLGAGAGFVLFTDGLVEGRTARRDSETALALFGEDRVREILITWSATSPQDLMHRLSRSVKEFAGGALADDVCILGCRLSTDQHATRTRSSQ